MCFLSVFVKRPEYRRPKRNLLDLIVGRLEFSRALV
jgi:hypothetical protein